VIKPNRQRGLRNILKHYHAPIPRSSRELASLAVEVWSISSRQHGDACVLACEGTNL
jgi:hypothetical protein